MFRVLVAALALLAVTHAARADGPVPDDRVGKPVAAGSLSGLDGKSTAVADLKGAKATVLAFVSFECPISNSYLTALNDLANDYGPKGVAVVAVCPTDEPAAAVARWAAEYKVAVKVVLDPKKRAAATVGAKVTPEAAVLDADGVLRYRGRIDDGYSARLKKNPTVTSFDLKDALDDLLAGKPVRTPVTKAVGCPIEYDPAPATTGEVTYHKHVAPILQKHCQGCHRPGEVGPFALATYKQARQWSADIKEYTASRQMPPWMPAAGVPIRGERKLTDAEIATLAAWADAGAPEGDPKDAPPAPEYPSGWRLGTPDLVLTPSEEFRLGPTGRDVFRCFVVPTGLTEDKWVIGYEVKPGNPRVVHHTLHFFDTSGQARELEQKHRLKEEGSGSADRGPGYPVAMGVGFLPAPRKGDTPTFGGVGGWAPGQVPQFLPKGAGWLLPKGSDFIIQTHYHRDGKPNADRTQVGLYFAKAPVDQPWQTVVLNGMKAWERIPVGKKDYVTGGAVYLHADAVLHNVMPHMHLLGKRVRVTMTPPGGQRVVLVDIPVWDYRWQETYWFKEPIAAKAGTKLEVEAVFDNSADNPNNPSRPPVEVTVGEQTTNEMLYVFFGVTSTKTPFERVRGYGYPPADAPDGAADGELTPVLERRLGAWDTQIELSIAGGKPTKMTGTEAVEKALGGKYVRGQLTNSAGGGGVVTLATYDPARKAYRMWLFDAQGTVIEFTGAHDEKVRTITWTGRPRDGVEAKWVWSFPTDDTFEWTASVTTGGQSVLELKGSSSRKKQPAPK